jgi:hypothetical protein
MVLLSAQGMDVSEIAKAALTSEDRVRDVIRNVNAGGSVAVPEVPRWPGSEVHLGAPPGEQEDRQVHGRPGTTWPFSTWSLPELAEFPSPIRH